MVNNEHGITGYQSQIAELNIFHYEFKKYGADFDVN